MRRVILESPYAGDVEANVAYARAAMRDSLKRGEAPIASHLLYTQPGVLDDAIPEERQMGIDAGLAWGHEAEATVVYVDRGISRGMQYGLDRALREGRPFEFRTLAPKPQTIQIGGALDEAAAFRAGVEYGRGAPRFRSRIRTRPS